MISRRDSSKKYKKALIFLVVCAACVLLWKPLGTLLKPVLEYTGFFSSSVFRSFSETKDAFSLYIRSNSALYAKNKELELALENERLKYLELTVAEDAASAHKDLGVRLESETVIFARRIGFIDSVFYQTFRIDRGVSHQVAPYMLVSGPGAILLGVVGTVDTRTSLVNALWGGETVKGRMSTSGAVIALQGVDSGLYASEVPHEMIVSLGDVVLYDQDPRFVIGTVKKINNNEGERFKEIIVQIPVHPQMIDRVALSLPL